MDLCILWHLWYLLGRFDLMRLSILLGLGILWSLLSLWNQLGPGHLWSLLSLLILLGQLVL